MSGFEALKPFLPALTSAGTGIARVGAGIAAQRTAEESAERLEQIGAEDARLRGIQAARLLGNLQASFGPRGVVGGTGDELEIQAARLEGMDIARARFRFTSLAAQVRARGDAALIGSITGSLGDLSSGFSEISRQSQIGDLQAKIDEVISKANRTVLDPTQKTLIPKPFVPGPLTTKKTTSVRRRIQNQVLT